jgi:putative hydrolase
MTPAAALLRAAYLLERQLAPSAKVAAFRRAAEVVGALDPDHVARLVRSGRVTDLAGIGPSTGGVVADAVEGRPSAYLAALEEASRIPVEQGADLLAALRGDAHAHSVWSDGGATTGAMARAARALGHEWLAMTDHSPRMSVARGLTPDRALAQLEEVAGLNADLEAEAAAGAAPFLVLSGMEVDINEDGSLDAPDELLGRLDLVVASPHVKLRMERPAMTRRLVLAAAHPHVDVLGHCTGRKVGWGKDRPRPPAEFDADVVFAACARFGTAVEVNCRPERQDPPDELLEVALEWGCTLVVNTDAHAEGQLEWQGYGTERLARLGVGPDRVLNAGSAEAVRAWAQGLGAR